jgi:hypothetical protein
VGVLLFHLHMNLVQCVNVGCSGKCDVVILKGIIFVWKLCNIQNFLLRLEYEVGH